MEILNSCDDCDEIQFKEDGNWAPMRSKKEVQEVPASYNGLEGTFLLILKHLPRQSFGPYTVSSIKMLSDSLKECGAFYVLNAECWTSFITVDTYVSNFVFISSRFVSISAGLGDLSSWQYIVYQPTPKKKAVTVLLLFPLLYNFCCF